MGTPTRRREIEAQVAVLGGGLAGLAAAVHLARRGLDVICLEPEAAPRERVGESLDWSSPALLCELGFAPGDLLEQGLATRKRHIRVTPHDGPLFELAPEPWFARAPWRLELETLHIDRGRFDARLAQVAQRAGVRFVRERVVRVTTEGERVLAVESATTRVRARRYVDASGRARLCARALGIERVDCGEPRVSQWTYLPLAADGEGTTLHLDGSAAALEWLWEIPIAADVLSVGWTQAASELQRRAAACGNAAAAFSERLRRVPRLRAALASHGAPEVLARSFQTYVHARTVGPNWLLVGEAAAMIDPLTSNGFTFALRSGAHAAELIAGSLTRAELPRRARQVYDRCQRRMARAFNGHIERAAYGPHLRGAFGLRRATWVYVLFGYFANALCQRLRPRRAPAAWALCAGLGVFRAWLGAWCLAARARAALRRTAGVHRASGSSLNHPASISTPVSKAS
ncbi:MAG TPA: FAD-dependent oxidoreductase [Planctomycetota bacterium]|nr:FAD-dependent oxidoreductase [Planctomycetota bacterium]